MMRIGTVSIGLAAVALMQTGCTDKRTNPAAPNTTRSPSLSLGRAGDEDVGGSREGDDGDRGALRLVAVIGPGQGWIRATRIPNPTTPGNFAVHIEISIHNMKPNTDYVGQRAAESFPPPGPPAGFDVSTIADGSCQRGLGLAPWSALVPPRPVFVSFPDQAHGLPAVVITTDGAGNGAADFVILFPYPLPLFDVMFRVIENSSAPTSVLMSDCTILPLP
jgi:hypothetical protein